MLKPLNNSEFFKLLKMVGLLCVCGTLTTAAHAQSIVADLRQDVALLRAELGQQRLSMETLLSNNQRLSDRLHVQQDTLQSFQASLQSLRAELLQTLDTERKRILKTVLAQIETLQTQANNAAAAAQAAAAKQQLAQAQAAQASAAAAAAKPANTVPNVSFPQNGIAYTVQKGDSLWNIANAHNSRVNWIQAANNIANPGALRPGAELFIPQE